MSESASLWRLSCRWGRVRAAEPALFLRVLLLSCSMAFVTPAQLVGEEPDRAKDGSAEAVDEPGSPDRMREMQSEAVRQQFAGWGHWGNQPEKFGTWTNHSNRLIPLYTFGMTLDPLRQAGSVYSDPESLEQLYGRLPEGTVNPFARYYDQTDVYRLLQQATDLGKRHLIVMVFDGMDWQTTRAAAVYRAGKVTYDTGRGSGLAFQDYRGTPTDFGFIVTSAALGGAAVDVDTQAIVRDPGPITGGLHPLRAGPMPWHEPTRSPYPLGLDRQLPHTVTDSAASATSLFSGIKTYNGAINVDIEGKQVTPIARQLQAEGYRVGVVTSVPVSHATPAAGYANNVSRKDYQDLSRDLLGLPSVSHPEQPLSGVDVLIGGGWGEGGGRAPRQGENFLPGNTYLHESDLEAATDPDGHRRYVLAERTKGRDGTDVLNEATDLAVKENRRLLGFFGTRGGHLPFQTADGNFNPTFDVRGTERYTAGDVLENPTLAEMTRAALQVLAVPADGDGDSQPAPFWLVVEAGDVDWANHANNLDNSIGAVLSGEAAFSAITDWVETNDAWDDTVLLLTSDHGHFLVLDDIEQIADAGAAGREGSGVASENP